MGIQKSADNVQIHVLLPRGMRDNLVEAAERQGRTLSELVRRALYRYSSPSDEQETR